MKGMWLLVGGAGVFPGVEAQLTSHSSASGRGGPVAKTVLSVLLQIIQNTHPLKE